MHDSIATQPEQLKAPVSLPSEDEMTLQLVVANSIERLEEYQREQNVIFLLIGLFGGSIDGILVNWATNETFIITRFSLVLLFLFTALTIICVLFALYIHRRIKKVSIKRPQRKASSGMN